MKFFSPSEGMNLTDVTRSRSSKKLKTNRVRDISETIATNREYVQS
jgi:hypothetical protein